MSDLITINTNGLEEAIRCAICENPIKSESGCDGSCRYDEKLLKRIIEAVNGCIEEQKRPHGEWEEELASFGYVDLKCSVCGCLCECVECGKQYNFCPNCGADMRKGGDGE